MVAFEDEEEPGAIQVYDIRPLLLLTSLRELKFSLGHLYPDPSGLSTLTGLTGLALRLMGLLIDEDDEVSLTEYDPLIEEDAPSFSREMNSHLPLFGMTSLRCLVLDGFCVATLSGIHELTSLTSLSIGWYASVTDVYPIGALKQLGFLELLCPGVTSLISLLRCRNLRQVVLRYDQYVHAAALPGRIRNVVILHNSDDEPDNITMRFEKLDDMDDNIAAAD